MNKVDKIMSYLKENLKKEITEYDECYINFKNGKCLNEADVEKIIKRYNDIEDKIIEYIEGSELDNVLDKDIIKEHFPQYAEFFLEQQACLIDINKFAEKVYTEYLG